MLTSARQYLMEQSTVSSNVKTAYDEFYAKHDEAWRMLGAKYKAQHIIDVCKGLNLQNVLEVGAGDGSVLKHLADAGFAQCYEAVEISESGVDHILSRNIPGLSKVQLFDGYTLPYNDNSFDLIILSHVLEHVEHERILLREIKRVANRCVIEVPLDYKPGVDKRIRHFLAYGHINVYTPSLLRYLLLTEGFEVENDLTSLIPPEVTKFNTYINQKKQRNFLLDLKVAAEYTFKVNFGNLAGKPVKERFASAYTVLCRTAAAKPEIF